MTAGLSVGIDLGTTNTVVASTAPGETVPRVFPIEQLVTRDTAEARPLLPSFLYAPLTGEIPGDPDFIVGELAKRRGAEVPSRGVASAKSWLCHAQVDRTAAILPFGLAEDVTTESPKISPLDASRRLLEHVHHTWDARRDPSLPELREATVALTVPASFDDDARELTRLAAERAGLSVVLLEEPVAALYDFLARDDADARLAALGEGALVLVCDVGGGTTDLSLVRVTDVGTSTPTLTRVASGRHILLGGDNMDLALAYALEPRFVQRGDKLSPSRFAELTAGCRTAKELLFSGEANEANVVLVGQGSKLVGGTRTTTLDRALAEAIVCGGFFPRVERGELPKNQGAALRGLGLPFERDPAVSRHVAAFLARHAHEGSPKAVLLNGGVFRSEALVAAFMASVAATFDGEPHVLPNPDPDVAVARGAALFARLTSAGAGARIKGGTSRSYFVGLGESRDARGAEREAFPKAVCVVSRGAEEGTRHEARGRTFSLALGTRARFALFASDVDKSAPGEIVTLDETRFFPLPALATRLGEPHEKGTVEVTLEGEITHVGTLDLGCKTEDGRRFRLAFRLDSSDEQGTSNSLAPLASRAPTEPPPRVSLVPGATERVHSATTTERAVAQVQSVFGKKAEAGGREVKDLMRELEKTLGEKNSWSVETARKLADVLLENPGARKRTADHERIFFQLAGHTLRPGRGAPGDEARIAIFAKTWDGRLAFPDEARGWSAFFVAFRRVASGLPGHVESAIADFAAQVLAPKELGLKRPKRMPEGQDELLSLAASLERVPPKVRGAFGEWFFDRVRAKDDARVWDALGKLGARVRSYGPSHEVLPVGLVETWLEKLVRIDWKRDPRPLARAAALLARRTGDRVRDVTPRLRDATLAKLEEVSANPAWIALVRDIVVPEDSTLEAGLFDDDLPPGLVLL